MWTSFVNLFLNLLLFIYKLVGNFGVHMLDSLANPFAQIAVFIAVAQFDHACGNG